MKIERTEIFTIHVGNVIVKEIFKGGLSGIEFLENGKIRRISGSSIQFSYPLTKSDQDFLKYLVHGQ